MSILLPTRRALNVGAWASNSLWKAAKSVPSLDLRFADTKSLTDAVSGQNLITFTRASSGTYVGSDGLIKTAAVNEPRFDHNPTTGESLGLLVEEQRTNIWLNSQNATLWTSSGASSANNYTIAPDGTQTASRILFSGSTSAWSIVYQGNFTGTYIWSAWLKTEDGSSKTIYVTWGIPDAAKRVTLNIDGTWKRYSALVTPSGENVHLGNHNTITPPGWSAFNIHIWGAQLEAGTFPTSYIPTTSSQVTRSADVASIAGANFTRWFNSSAFTVYGDAIGYNAATTVTNSGSGYPYIYSLHSANTNRLVGARAAGGTNNGSWSIYSSPPNQFGYTTGANFNTVQKHKVGGAYSSSEYLAFADGVIGTSVAPSATTTSFTTLLIGSGTDGGYWGGTISRLTYWPSRLPNSILQDITR